MPDIGGLELVVMVLIAMIWVVPVAIVVLLVRANRARNVSPTSDSAMDALRIRLAKGEIDEPEYERLRTVLHSH